MPGFAIRGLTSRRTAGERLWCIWAAALESPTRHAGADLALLHSLGVRLVLVHASREAIDSALPTDHSAVLSNGLRADDLTLATAIDAAAKQRVQLERLLSMGLPNTPLKDAHIRVMAGTS